MHIRHCWILLFPLTLVLLTGCGGGGAELRSTSTATTIGQELIDLKKALDMGIISDDEYEDAKENILERQ